MCCCSRTKMYNVQGKAIPFVFCHFPGFQLSAIISLYRRVGGSPGRCDGTQNSKRTVYLFLQREKKKLCCDKTRARCSPLLQCVHKEITLRFSWLLKSAQAFDFNNSNLLQKFSLLFGLCPYLCSPCHKNSNTKAVQLIHIYF